MRNGSTYTEIRTLPSTMMPCPQPRCAQPRPRTATPASIARRRRPHHREFPTGYSSAGCSPAEPASASPAAPVYVHPPARHNQHCCPHFFSPSADISCSRNQQTACHRVVCGRFSKLAMEGGLAEPRSKLASLCSIEQTHPFVPTCPPAERRAQPRSRLAVGHRRRRRAAVWTAASTVLG